MYKGSLSWLTTVYCIYTVIDICVLSNLAKLQQNNLYINPNSYT